MTNFSTKCVLLGVGIGIIIASIAGMIYYAGTDPLKNLSEGDIQRLEQRYGLTRIKTLESVGEAP